MRWGNTQVAKIQRGFFYFPLFFSCRNHPESGIQKLHFTEQIVDQKCTGKWSTSRTHIGPLVWFTWTFGTSFFLFSSAVFFLPCDVTAACFFYYLRACSFVFKLHVCYHCLKSEHAFLFIYLFFWCKCHTGWLVVEGVHTDCGANFWKGSGTEIRSV